MAHALHRDGGKMGRLQRFGMRIGRLAGEFAAFVAGVEPRAGADAPAPVPAAPKSRQEQLNDALLRAARDGDIRTAERLLGEGAEWYCKCGHHNMALHALQYGKLEFARWARKKHPSLVSDVEIQAMEERLRELASQKQG